MFCAHYDSCPYYNGDPGQNPAPPEVLELYNNPESPPSPVPSPKPTARILTFTRRLQFWKRHTEAVLIRDDPLAFKLNEL